MARRTSRRRSTRRSSHRRRTRRNPKYVVAKNKRRRRRSSKRRSSRRPRRNSRRRSSKRRSSRKPRRNSRRRSSRRRRSRRPRRNSRRRSTKMRRNKRRRRVKRNQGLGSVNWGREVLTPVVAGTVGFVGARYLGNMAAMKDWGTSDTKLAKIGAAALGIPATYFLAARSPMVARNTGAIVLGMGLAAVEPYLRETKLLSGAIASPSPAPAPAGNGGGNGNGVLPGTAPAIDAPGEQTVIESGSDDLSAYYDYPMNSEGQALSDDYYTAGMLGASDPSDQAQVEASLDHMERGGGNGVKAISTVIPTDMALPAQTMPQWARVRERFANQSGRAHAGGMFARNLFSGMMGS